MQTEFRGLCQVKKFSNVLDYKIEWEYKIIRKEETMTETVTVLKKYPSCAERIEEQWKDRKEDLKDPDYDYLGFDYVEPHTFTDQLEGYWRWQFSWGGPSDELRAFVNENKEIHRLEYWFMDWMDGAKLELQQGPEWQKMQEMVEMS